MVKKAFVSLILVLSLQAVTAEEKKFALLVDFQPLGSFTYTTTDDLPVYVRSDPMINTSFILEYRLYDEVGVGGYLDVRGYRWRTIGPDDPLFGQIYGSPGFTGGVLGFWHFLPPDMPIDAYVAAGFGAKFYIESDDVWSGFDLSAVADLLYDFVPGMGLGLRAGASHSIHAGGPIDASTSKRPFTIDEINLGLVFRVKF